MSRLLSPADFRREIAALDGLIEQTEAQLRRKTDDFGADLSLFSLRQRRQELLDHVERLGNEGLPGQDLAVALSGEPVTNARIEADFLGVVLRRLQSLVTAILISSGGSSAGRRGPYRQAMMRAAQLRFAGSFEGSFGMRLEGGEAQLELDGTIRLGASFAALIDLVQSTRGDDTSLLTEVARLGPRPAAVYRTLLQDLARRGTSMTVRWQQIDGYREAEISAAQASHALEALSRFQEQHEVVFVHGRLDGANSRLGHFELVTEDGEVIKGDVDPQIVPLLREFFDVRCKAMLLKRTVLDQGTSEQKVHYQLQELSPPEA